MAVWVGLVVCELNVPGSRSLKEKRRVVRSFVERLHKRHRVSVAETGFRDAHQVSEVGLAVVAGTEGEVSRLLDSLRRAAEEVFDPQIARWEEEIVEAFGMMSNQGGDEP